MPPGKTSRQFVRHRWADYVSGGESSAARACCLCEPMGEEGREMLIPSSHDITAAAIASRSRAAPDPQQSFNLARLQRQLSQGKTDV
jgi:hypothetical protein